jgi:hypothetical protein
MKLNIFNPWKTLGTIYGRKLEYQSSPVQGSKKLLVTYVRDAESNATITKAYGATAEASKDAAIRSIKEIDAESLWNSIRTGEPVTKRQIPDKPKVNWRDGIGHSHRAQKRIVGEQEQIVNTDKPKPRNFVAKHARSVNKGGPMRDRKNDYKRKKKHSKQDEC